MARTFASGDLINVDGAVLNPTFTTAALTIAGWVKAAAGANQCMYGEGRIATTQSWYMLIAGTGNNKFFLGTSSGNFGTTTQVIADSTWHHVGWTFDGAAHWIAYVDGANVLSGTTAFGSFGTQRATLGSLRRSTTTFPFVGTLAHWATWTRTLAAQEIVSLHNGMLPSLLGPTHYWPLWGADSPEPDLGNGTHGAGTLTGTAFVSGVGQPSMLHV